MAESTASPTPTKIESALLVLFLPSVTRFNKPVDQDQWVRLALELLGAKFGGATAFPKGRGVWRDDERGGILVFDEPVVVQCYTNPQALEAHHADLLAFLVRLGRETEQGAVGFVLDRVYMEIPFPLEGQAPP
jgi:hypothetical protein